MTKSQIIVKNTKEVFMSQLKEDGTPDKEQCPNCNDWFFTGNHHLRQCGRKRGGYTK